jgi:hypothetical protein
MIMAGRAEGARDTGRTGRQLNHPRRIKSISGARPFGPKCGEDDPAVAGDVDFVIRLQDDVRAAVSVPNGGQVHAERLGGRPAGDVSPDHSNFARVDVRCEAMQPLNQLGDRLGTGVRDRTRLIGSGADHVDEAAAGRGHAALYALHRDAGSIGDATRDLRRRASLGQHSPVRPEVDAPVRVDEPAAGAFRLARHVDLKHIGEDDRVIRGGGGSRVGRGKWGRMDRMRFWPRRPAAGGKERKGGKPGC